MRRVFVCIVTVGALALSMSLAQAGIRAERRAEATFLLPEHNGIHQAIWVSGIQGNGWGPAGTFAIAQGFCADENEPEGCAVSSRGFMTGHIRDGDILEFDPDLGTAHLKVTRRGTTHEVTWMAGGAGEIVNWDFECINNLEIGQATGISRTGSAAGSVLGREVSASSTDPRIVSVGAMTYSC